MTSLPHTTAAIQQETCPTWCAVTGDHIEGMHSVEKIVRVGDQHVQVTLIQDFTDDTNAAYLSLTLTDAHGVPVEYEPETLGTHRVKHAALSAVLSGVVTA